MKIAVCDDCHEDAMRLETFLEGQDIRLYFDPQRLLADVENRQMRFDLYLLDIFMDDSMGGIELAERIRARLFALSPPAMLFTGRHMISMQCNIC